MIDIITTGQNGFDKLNNPLLFSYKLFQFGKYKTPLKSGHLYMKGIEKPTTYQYVKFGISIEEIEKNPKAKPLYSGLQIIHKLLSECKEKGIYLIGYNHIKYDIKILNDNFKYFNISDEIVWDENNIIDVAQLSELTIESSDIGCYSMDAVYYTLYNDFAKKEFPVTPDYENDKNNSIFDKLCEKHNFKSFSEVATFINKPRIITKFNTGKYNGLTFEEVFYKRGDEGRKYMNWLIKNPRTNKNLVVSLKGFLNNV